MRTHRELILKEIAGVLEKVSEKSSQAFLKELARTRRVYISGVGRSGLVVKAFGQRLMHLGFEVHLADEISAPGIRRGDLLVACSGSGTTHLTVYMARKAKAIGARCVALTARSGSPLARVARLVVLIPAPLERGSNGNGTRQPARSLFEQALFIYLDGIVLAALQKLGISQRRLARRHANLE